MARTHLDGRVYESDSGDGIGGVSVSNGEAIVQTASDGRYTLEIDRQRDRYVFVSVPSGFRPQKRFYTLLGDEESQSTFDFPLIAAPERARNSFRLAHLSDTHVVTDDSGAVSGELLAQDLEEIVSTAAPDLAVITGDLTNMGTIPELEHYRSAIDSVSIPVISVFGGHDGNIERRSTVGDAPCTRNFEATLGPTYYSFDWGEYHFVVYATEESYFTAGDRERKERWLWADLALQPGSRRSVLMLHTAPDQALLEQFSRHNGALILHGHWHSSRVFAFGETIQASAPAACFGGIDTRPRGFRLVSFSPQGIETALQASPRPAARSTGATRLEGAQSTEQPRRGIALGEERFAPVWQHETGSPLHRAAPVGYEDSVLVSLHDESHPSRNGVTCLDSFNGKERWHYETQTALKNSCVVVAGMSSDDTGGDAWCAALSVTGELHLIAMATGKRAWSTVLPSHPQRWVYSSPAHNGKAIVAGSKAGYGAYDLATGAQNWYFSPSDGDEWPAYICPQIYNKELCIVLVQRQGFLALSMEAGEVVWEQNMPVEYFCASPVLAGDVVVVSSASPHTGASLTGGQQGDIAVLAARTGDIVAHYSRVLPGYATGVAVAGNRIYAATAAGTVHCLDVHTGKQLWQFQSGEDLLDFTPYRRGITSLTAAPAPLGGHILVGGCDGWLYALDSQTGTCTDRAFLGAPITAAPCAIPDGFCVGTYGGTLFAYRSAG